MTQIITDNDDSKRSIAWNKSRGAWRATAGIQQQHGCCVEGTEQAEVCIIRSLRAHDISITKQRTSIHCPPHRTAVVFEPETAALRRNKCDGEAGSVVMDYSTRLLFCCYCSTWQGSCSQFTMNIWFIVSFLTAAAATGSMHVHNTDAQLMLNLP